MEEGAAVRSKSRPISRDESAVTLEIITPLGRGPRSASASANAGGQNGPAGDARDPSKLPTSAYLGETPGFFNLHESNFFSPPESNKGWDDIRLQALLRSLGVMADDRSEMHAAVAVQRDNWGKLLQVTITMSMISAGILSALNTRAAAAASLSLSVTASLLAGGSFFFMCLENWFQPSQLAEEQRAASRFFKALVREIEGSLKPGGSYLKEEAHVFYESKLQRLQYLDKAFPLPLFPGGIDKFPEVVGPSVLSAPVDTSKPEVPLSEDKSSNNGWTAAIVEDLKKTSALLKKSEIATYVGWEKNAQKINKVLAISGPALALTSVVANFVNGGALVAAACSVLAALVSSFSHDAQVGMVYEMYRDVAGSFEDIDKEIQRNLRMPVEQREDGQLFHERIALTLGRDEDKPIVASDDQTSAGSLL
ncbi:hypothetical protein AXG93_3719s1410 [Marchantia polymorpha subsp. ruderalis]|uniref:Uncharacterized protein n=1 Tax=Marchantia polymorpha subsp. ruderalis TaxID=1480154 RepID=A0A176VP61_MARPO|nr:hypothetical protein AXG93_3719s1410 [Marchantia polymorpha subsp. ruderalis]